MPANRKPRKAYRPRDVVPVPLVFGASKSMQMSFGIKSRQAIDAVLAHDQDIRHLYAIETEIVAAMHALDIAANRPDDHDNTPESIEAIRGELKGVGRAILSIKARHASTGRIGCDSSDRAALLTLGELLDVLRAGLPRRIWFEAYKRSLTIGDLTADELA